MRIATLQLASRLGERDVNIALADQLLSQKDLSNIDLLVLPEMAFSGRCLSTDTQQFYV